MKKLLLLLSLSLGCFVLSSCSSEVKKYVIKGHVDKYESDLLMTMVNETGKVDTIHEVRSVNGDFEMGGVINGPKLAFLTIKGVNGRIPLLLEDTLFTLNIRAKDLADVRNYDIQGGRLQAGKNALDDVEIEVFSDRDSILACYFEAEKNHDIAGKMHERAMLDRMTIAYDKEENKFIEANKDNILGLAIVYYRYNYLNFDRLKVKFELLSDAMKNTPEGRLIQARYDKLGVVKVGRQAPDFTLPTLDGSTVTLYDVKAPVKILDFWASWCAPCRKENPNMVKTYEKFKDKGLVIIGISMDAREGDWKKAVETDGLTWIQACDYKNTAGEVARAYNITAIPRVLVLDKNNRVIADGLTGEMLDEFLAKRLN